LPPSIFEKYSGESKARKALDCTPFVLAFQENTFRNRSRPGARDAQALSAQKEAVRNILKEINRKWQ